MIPSGALALQWLSSPVRERLCHTYSAPPVVPAFQGGKVGGLATVSYWRRSIGDTIPI
jgi:hypothetical protein